ncbi:hypothetical protein CR513_19725, partial [Mucuna pruriens]
MDRGLTTKTNDAKVVVNFVRFNIFCKFGVPKELISEYGEIKQILQKMVHLNRKGWSQLSRDALWMQETAYQISLGMSPYRIAFAKACHLLLE